MLSSDLDKTKKKVINTFKIYKKSFSKKVKTRYLTFAVIIFLIAGAGYLTKSLFLTALINGVPLTRYEYVKKLEEAAGDQILESLITEKLIYQEAQNKGVKVGDQAVEDEINKISAMLSEQGNTLEDVLGYQNQTMDDLKKSIKLQKIVEELLNDKIDVNDEEVSDYYEQNKDLYGGEAVFEDLKEDIKNQLKSQKLNEEFTVYLENLKNESKIIYF